MIWLIITAAVIAFGSGVALATWWHRTGTANTAAARARIERNSSRVRRQPQKPRTPDPPPNSPATDKAVLGALETVSRAICNDGRASHRRADGAGTVARRVRAHAAVSAHAGAGRGPVP